MFGFLVKFFVLVLSFSMLAQEFSIRIIKDIFSVYYTKGAFFVTSNIIGIIVSLAVGYNLLKLKEWARKAVIILSIIGIALGVFTFVTFCPTKFVPVLAPIIIYYFTRPKVKEQFS